MEEYARCLAYALARTDNVIVYTREGRGIPSAPFAQRPILTGILSVDEKSLASEKVDAWYALNAGWLAAAPRLRAPFFANFFGNDFLNPWVGYQRRWVDSLERAPYVWRYTSAVRRTVRRSFDIRRGVRSAAHLFAISHATASLSRRVFPGCGRKLSVIYPGVDAAFFQNTTARTRHEVLRLLTVSRLDRACPRKNVDGVLHAIALLPSNLRVAYTVVGDGDDRLRLERLAEELRIGDRVRFRGGVTRDELFACYRDSDLFILASKKGSSDVEGFGIVYLEASASGVPVICSAEGGATDGVEDGWNGILIPTSSPPDIARGIRRFAESRDQFPPERVSAFAERFNWPTIAGQIRSRIASHIHVN